MPAPKLLELGVKVKQRCMNKFNPSVCPGQAVKNVAVENKRTENFAARFQGVMQGGVVFDPQVAPEPHQPGLVFFGHAQHGSQTASRRFATSPGREKFAANGFRAGIRRSIRRKIK